MNWQLLVHLTVDTFDAYVSECTELLADLDLKSLVYFNPFACASTKIKITASDGKCVSEKNNSNALQSVNLDGKLSLVGLGATKIKIQH